MINVGSQTMVHYLIMDNPPCTVRYEVGNIKADMGEFQACSLEHCYRETNALEDTIAAVGTSKRRVELELSYLSNAIM